MKTVSILMTTSWNRLFLHRQQDTDVQYPHGEVSQSSTYILRLTWNFTLLYVLCEVRVKRAIGRFTAWLRQIITWRHKVIIKTLWWHYISNKALSPIVFALFLIEILITRCILHEIPQSPVSMLETKLWLHSVTCSFDHCSFIHLMCVIRLRAGLLKCNPFDGL